VPWMVTKLWASTSARVMRASYHSPFWSNMCRYEGLYGRMPALMAAILGMEGQRGTGVQPCVRESRYNRVCVSQGAWTPKTAGHPKPARTGRVSPGTAAPPARTCTCKGGYCSSHNQMQTCRHASMQGVECSY
jgi:hypothetical protein